MGMCTYQGSTGGITYNGFGWVTYDFGTPVEAKSFRLVRWNTGYSQWLKEGDALGPWYIKGSTDNVNWDILYTGQPVDDTAAQEVLEDFVAITDAPTAAPTAAPTVPTASTASSPASAKGDPHLQNINGQRFDLM